MAGELKITDFNSNQNYIVVTDTNPNGVVDPGDTSVASKAFDGYAVGDRVNFIDEGYSSLRTQIRNSLLIRDASLDQIARIAQDPTLANNGFSSLKFIDNNGTLYVYHRNNPFLPFGAILTTDSPQESIDAVSVLQFKTDTISSPASDEAYIAAIANLALQHLEIQNVEILEKAIKKANQALNYDPKIPRNSIFYDESTKRVYYPRMCPPLTLLGDSSGFSAVVNFSEIKSDPCLVRVIATNLNGTTRSYILDVRSGNFTEQ